MAYTFLTFYGCVATRATSIAIWHSIDMGQSVQVLAFLVELHIAMLALHAANAHDQLLAMLALLHAGHLQRHKLMAGAGHRQNGGLGLGGLLRAMPVTCFGVARLLLLANGTRVQRTVPRCPGGRMHTAWLPRTLHWLVVLRRAVRRTRGCSTGLLLLALRAGVHLAVAGPRHRWMLAATDTGAAGGVPRAVGPREVGGAAGRRAGLLKAARWAGMESAVPSPGHCCHCALAVVRRRSGTQCPRSAPPLTTTGQPTTTCPLKDHQCSLHLCLFGIEQCIHHLGCHGHGPVRHRP